MTPIGRFKSAGLLVLLSVLFSLIWPTAVFAAETLSYSHHPNIRDRRVVGTIKEINRNIITIYDEEDKILRRLVEVGKIEGIQVGDRVSIYYFVNGGVVENIKKMRFVEYKEDGQNLGYMFKR
ncbi:MAG: hypothetical protein WCH62_03550 [Candidatus Omnitrophota bacterium]